ncbi:MAG: phosphoserine phosphatase SerB [Actinomycetaceae bacterium]|nr:phosphoserine phosphatase SerB [Actinomycetaceae bacterium]
MAVVSGALLAGPKLVVTDVDSTLIVQEVIEELAAAAGTRTQVANITAAAMAGKLDFAHSLALRVATLQGVPVTVFENVLARIRLRTGARELIDNVHRCGAHFGVVSGGFIEVVTPLAAQLGIDYVRANRLEIKDGFLTGRTVGKIVTGEVKEEALRTWAGTELDRSVAIGDGANDLPMLNAAGLGIGFCPKPVVAKNADAVLDWPNLGAAWGMICPTSYGKCASSSPNLHKN